MEGRESINNESEPVPPITYMDDDDYEDTGELRIPGNLRGIYLTSIPRLLWDSWTALDEDEEIKVGNVRVWGANGQNQKVNSFTLLKYQGSAKLTNCVDEAVP